MTSGCGSVEQALSCEEITCGANATCQETSGTAQCVCDDGFEDVGGACEPEDNGNGNGDNGNGNGNGNGDNGNGNGNGNGGDSSSNWDEMEWDDGTWE